MKNNPSFYEKQPVVLLKVTCRFFLSDPSFFLSDPSFLGKQALVI